MLTATFCDNKRKREPAFQNSQFSFPPITLVFGLPREILYDMSNAIDMHRRRFMPTILRIIVCNLNRCVSVIDQIETKLSSHVCSEILEK